MREELARYRQWLRRKSPSSSTLRHYTSDLELFFRFANKPPGEVTLRDVDGFIGHCQRQGHRPSTINRRLAALHSFYRFLAVESDAAPPNPVLPHRHYIRKGRHLPRDVEDHVLQRLFDVISDTRDRAIFLLMLRCGARVGEICALSLGDLYLQATPGGLPRLWLHGKGGYERVAYLSAQVLTALKAWLKVRPKVTDQAVFLNWWGRRLSVSGVQKRMEHYCRQAGLHICCHQLRHTFGRHLAEARVPVTTIQRLLGHHYLRSTEAYLNVSDGQTQDDYNAAMLKVTARLRLPGGTR